MTKVEKHHRRLTRTRLRAFEKLFGGPPKTVFPHSEFASAKSRFLIDVYVYLIKHGNRRVEVAVTNGMSDRRLVDGRNRKVWARRELVQYFPRCTPEHAVRLFDMAWVPLFDRFLIDHGHTVAWDRPAVKETPWTNAFFLNPRIKAHRDFSVTVERDSVRLLWHVPISPIEREYKLQDGSEALEDRLTKSRVSWVFDESKRKPVATEMDVVVPVFMPSLVSWLLRAEKVKGSALTETEVLRIRDQAPCMMMSLDKVRTLEESRGYRDIEPEQVWNMWQQERLDLLSVSVDVK